MTDKPEKQENILLNLLLNIAIPSIILIKFSGDEWLGARNGVIVALAFPIAYGIYDYFRSGKFNLFSGIGIVSVLLTGGISLMELDPKYIAIKEATIPAVLGLIALGSIFTRYPLLKLMLFNEKMVQVDKVHDALKVHQNERAFESSFRTASVLFASSFFLSAVLNYLLARYIVVSPPGTEAFNSELGRMTALSYPVIAVPSLIVIIGSLFYLFRQITKLTQLSLEEILNDPKAS